MSTDVATRPSTSVPWTQQTITFARRTILVQLKNRRSLAFAFAFPVLYYFLATEVFVQQAGPTPTIKATMAVALGMFGAFAVALNGFAQQLGDDLSTKRYRKFRSLPLSSSADFTGRLLGSYGVAIVAYAVVLLVAFLHGAAFDVGPASILVILGSLFAFCVVAMGVATLVAVVVSGETVFQITLFILILAFFGTGYNGMSSRLPAGLQNLVNYVPNSLVTRLQIASLVDPTNTVTPPPLPTSLFYWALLVAYALLFGTLATVLLRRYVYAGEVGE